MENETGDYKITLDTADWLWIGFISVAAAIASIGIPIIIWQLNCVCQKELNNGRNDD